MNCVIEAAALALMNLFARQMQVINQVWSLIRSQRLNNKAAGFTSSDEPGAVLTDSKLKRASRVRHRALLRRI